VPVLIVCGFRRLLLCARRSVWVAGAGGSKDLMQEKSEEGYVMIRVRPEGGTCGPCLDITLDKRDMRSKCSDIPTLDDIMKS